MKVQKGDKVVVITGNQKGVRSEILEAFPKSKKVVVKDVAMRTKHVKKTREKSGEIITFEAPIDASNVMVLDSEGNPTRVSYEVRNGKKVRVAKTNGKELSGSFKNKA